MTHSDAGTQLVSTFEGFSPTAYQDIRGIWTIGFGHTGTVKQGDICTFAQAKALLNSDLATADAAVAKAIHVQVSQNMWDAMVSLAYNIGASAFFGSTVARDLNAGLIAQAADAFLMWHRPNLLRRRNIERTLFLKPENA